MSGVSNPINMPKFLDDQSAYLLAELFAKILEEAGNTQGVVQTETNNLGTQLTDVLNQILTKIATENDQNQAILESLTTVNGELDTNVQTINDHTTTENDTLRGEIFAELQRTSPGSLYNLLVNWIGSDLNATRSEITGGTTVMAARDAVLNEIVRTNAGSLYDLLKAELLRTSAGSLYDLLVTEISGAEANIRGGWSVNAARQNINTNTDNEATATRNAVYNARDAVKDELVRTSAGSLFKQLIDWIAVEVKDGWSINDARNNLYSSLNSSISNARDNVKSHIDANKSPVKSIQRGRFYGSVPANGSTDITISSVNLAKAHLSGQLSVNYGADIKTPFYSYELINSTTIRIYSSYGNEAWPRFSWEVVEYV